LAFYPVVIAVYASYVWVFRRFREHRRGDEEARVALLAGVFLVLSTLWCSILLGRLYAQVTFGMGTMAGLLTARVARPRPRDGLVAMGVALGLAPIAGLHRSPLSGPRLSNTELRPLLTANSGGEFDLGGARDAIEYLRNRPGAIAILSDSAAIIPIGLGRPTVEPVDHYCLGLTIPFDPAMRRRWEERFEDIMERQGVL